MSHAWLEWNGTLYWARYDRVRFEPHSAIAALIDGVWQTHPGSAHFILRSRIFVDYEPTELCRGMVLVCAKRMTRVARVPEDIRARMDSPFAAAQSIRVGPRSGGLLSPTKTILSQLRAEQNRSVECWLLSSSGRLLACASNTAGRNRTRHAELNLLQEWWRREGRPLPAGGRLLTTLEPCPMCAGAIWECVERRDDFVVEFLDFDPGTAVQRSVLRGTELLQHCKDFEHIPAAQD